MYDLLPYSKRMESMSLEVSYIGEVIGNPILKLIESEV